MASAHQVIGRPECTVRGWVYVISNESMPGVVKVGYSFKDPKERAEELAYTGAPTPYLVHFALELAAHQRLDRVRINDRRGVVSLRAGGGPQQGILIENLVRCNRALVRELELSQAPHTAPSARRAPTPIAAAPDPESLPKPERPATWAIRERGHDVPTNWQLDLQTGSLTHLPTRRAFWKGQYYFDAGGALKHGGTRFRLALGYTVA